MKLRESVVSFDCNCEDIEVFIMINQYLIVGALKKE